MKRGDARVQKAKVPASAASGPPQAGNEEISETRASKKRNPPKRRQLAPAPADTAAQNVAPTKAPVPSESGPADPSDEKSSRQLTVTSGVTSQTKYAEALAEAKRQTAQAFGVKDLELATRIIDQAGGALSPFGNAQEASQVALKMLPEFQPQSITEAMLATQMIGVYHAALSFLQRASIPGMSAEGVNSDIQASVRLMRLYNEQLEAMARLKGKVGHQEVRVEHVHIHGGQAIVGAVGTAELKQGEGGKNEKRKKTP